MYIDKRGDELNRDCIVYKPFRTQFVFAPICGLIGMVFCFFSGMTLAENNGYAFGFALVSVLCLGLAKYLNDSANIAVILDDEGVRVLNEKGNKYFLVRWQAIQHGYYYNNYKGHMFLVLSPDVLSLEQVRNVVNRAAIKSKLHSSDGLVIYLDAFQDTSALKEYVESRTISIRKDNI